MTAPALPRPASNGRGLVLAIWAVVMVFLSVVSAAVGAWGVGILCVAVGAAVIGLSGYRRRYPLVAGAAELQLAVIAESRGAFQAALDACEAPPAHPNAFSSSPT